MSDNLLDAGAGPFTADSVAAGASPLEPASYGTSAPTVLRVLLGTQLRQLREARGISAQAAARAIRASDSKISRIELGRNAVREVDIADLLTLYGVSDAAERKRLLTLAGLANQQGWWRSYQDLVPLWFQPYLGLEESAESIRSFDAQFVPGLLQTPEYAAAVMQLGSYSREEAERMVQLRAERQQRVAATGLRLTAVIDEVVLRRPVGTPGVLRGQLEYLLESAGRPGLTLRISPYLTGAWYAAPVNFSILTFAIAELPDVVYVEQLASASYLDRRVEVERYAAAMDQIIAAAATPEQTAELIRSLLGEVS